MADFNAFVRKEAKQLFRNLRRFTKKDGKNIRLNKIEIKDSDEALITLRQLQKLLYNCAYHD